MAKQSQIKETPTLIEKIDPNQYQINVIIKDCEKYGTIVQVAEWANKTGFDITLCGKSGSFQHLSITKEEVIIVNDAITKLIG